MVPSLYSLLVLGSTRESSRPGEDVPYLVDARILGYYASSVFSPTRNKLGNKGNFAPYPAALAGKTHIVSANL